MSQTQFARGAQPGRRKTQLVGSIELTVRRRAGPGDNDALILNLDRLSMVDLERLVIALASSPE